MGIPLSAESGPSVTMCSGFGSSQVGAGCWADTSPPGSASATPTTSASDATNNFNRLISSSDLA